MDYKTQKLGCAFEIPQMQKANAKKDKKNEISKNKNIFMDYKSQNFGFAFAIPQMQMPKVKSKIYTHKL